MSSFQASLRMLHELTQRSEQADATAEVQVKQAQAAR